MYDFNFKTKKAILKKPEDYLIFTKRLLPRWVNGIPDCEIIEIFKIINKCGKNKVYIETGCGASTICLVLSSILNKSQTFSWDTNGSKGHFLYSVLNETFAKKFNININHFWTFIPSKATNKYTGIGILKEKKMKAKFGFFDSEHTLDNLNGEVQEFIKVSDKKALIALDDAYYKYRTINIPYTNMLRSKLKLKKITSVENNECENIEIYTEIKFFS